MRESHWHHQRRAKALVDLRCNVRHSKSRFQMGLMQSSNCYLQVSPKEGKLQLLQHSLPSSFFLASFRQVCPGERIYSELKCERELYCTAPRRTCAASVTGMRSAHFAWATHECCRCHHKFNVSQKIGSRRVGIWPRGGSVTSGLTSIDLGRADRLD